MSYLRVFCPIFILLIFIFSGASAQEDRETADLVTDRPDQTESSISVPYKTIQIETGFSGELAPSGPSSVLNVSYGGTLLRYGLFKGMEMRLAMDYSTSRPFVSTGMEPDIERGVSPVVLGAKINLAEQHGWIPELALIVHVNLPVFDSDFAIDHAVPDIIVAASHSISDNFSLGYNFGIEWADTNESPMKKYSAVVGIGVSDRIGLFVESFGSFGNGGITNIIDGGLTFLILPNLQYDISGGVGTTTVSPVFFIGTGLSFRLPQ